MWWLQSKVLLFSYVDDANKACEIYWNIRLGNARWALAERELSHNVKAWRILCVIIGHMQRMVKEKLCLWITEKIEEVKVMSANYLESLAKTVCGCVVSSCS